LAGGAPPMQRQDSPRGMELNSREWNQTVRRLAVAFYKLADPEAVFESAPIGKLSTLKEDETRYYAVAIMNKGKDRLKLATIAWLKEPLRSWLAKAETQAPVTMATESANYILPTIATPSGGCTNDTWIQTSITNAPDARVEHVTVWTGTEMIVWSGINDSGYLNTGGRYNPSTDAWTSTTTTNAPTARYGHRAVWTGSEMIVWGGFHSSFLNTGGRYNPITDNWSATSTNDAPAGRFYHSAVWTGTEMIVWGGKFSVTHVNTGGRYNPSSDSWIATSINGAPTARWHHTAVWTGIEMIVWGGNNSVNDFNTGGGYNPGTDS